MKINRIKFTLVATIIPCVAAAGSFTSYGPIYSRYKMTPENGGGCISGTIGDAIPGNRDATIYFVSEKNSETSRKYAYFGYSDDSIKDDFLPGLSTFTMCLKPGKYRIIAIATYDLVSSNRINIPFEVIAGKNNYIGSFVFYGYTPEPDCLPTTARVFVGHRDELTRDKPYLIISKGFPKIPLEHVPLKIQENSPYLVSCKVRG